MEAEHTLHRLDALYHRITKKGTYMRTVDRLCEVTPTTTHR